MPDKAFDVEAWFKRIGYAGPRDPTLATLQGLVFAHAHAISYESLDIMLGQVPKLDAASLQQKMINRRRGGYCFEQNMLFRTGLLALGFKVTSLQGRKEEKHYCRKGYLARGTASLQKFPYMDLGAFRELTYGHRGNHRVIDDHG